MYIYLKSPGHDIRCMYSPLVSVKNITLYDTDDVICLKCCSILASLRPLKSMNAPQDTRALNRIALGTKNKMQTTTHDGHASHTEPSKKLAGSRHICCF